MQTNSGQMETDLVPESNSISLLRLDPNLIDTEGNVVYEEQQEPEIPNK